MSASTPARGTEPEQEQLQLEPGEAENKERINQWLEKYAVPLRTAVGVSHWHVRFGVERLPENEDAEDLGNHTVMICGALESYWDASIRIECRPKFGPKSEGDFVLSLIHELCHLHLAPLDIALNNLRLGLFDYSKKTDPNRYKIQQMLEKEFEHAIERSVRNMVGMFQLRGIALPWLDELPMPDTEPGPVGETVSDRARS